MGDNWTSRLSHSFERDLSDVVYSARPVGGVSMASGGRGGEPV